MAKVTDEFCRKRFYRTFARMTPDQQRGVLEAFETLIELTKMEPEEPLFEDTQMEGNQ